GRYSLMTTTLRCIGFAAACWLWAATAGAQTQTNSNATTAAPQTSSSQSTSSPDESTRPATTTFYGDTGLWYVPTAEVLAHGKWSVSAYRRGTNWIQGYTNVADFNGTFAVGIKNRAEIFGALLFDTRIDRDTYPLFNADSNFGGYEFRGKADGFEAPSGAFHWGTGVTFPSRNFLRVVGELNGSVPSADTVSMLSGTTIVGTDGSVAPALSATENITRATLGL